MAPKATFDAKVAAMRAVALHAWCGRKIRICAGKPRKEEMQVQMRALVAESAMLKKKCEETASEGSDAESSSSDGEAEPSQTSGQLQKENDQLRARVIELENKLGAKASKSRRVSEKVLLQVPTDAMKLRDPVAADEITKLIVKIRADEGNLGKTLSDISKMTENGQKHLEQTMSQKALYESMPVKRALIMKADFQHLKTLRACKRRREDIIEVECAALERIEW